MPADQGLRPWTSATAISPPTIRTIRGRPVAKMDFGLWRGSQGRHRRPSARSWSTGLARRGPRASPTTNRNLCIFPNLVINDGSSVTVRHLHADRARSDEGSHRLGARPGRGDRSAAGGGGCTPSLHSTAPAASPRLMTLRALELAQQGYAALARSAVDRSVPPVWATAREQLATDEGHLARVSGAQWTEMMEERGHEQAARSPRPP